MATSRTTDVQGYEVVLEDERWEHIVNGHPEVKEYRDLLLATVKEAELIQQDPDRDEVFYYYRLTGRSILRRNDLYMSVVVERSEPNKVGRVLTGHFVRTPKKGGKLVWFKPQLSSR